MVEDATQESVPISKVVPPPPTPPAGRRGAKRGLVIGAVIAAVALILVVAGLLLLGVVPGPAEQATSPIVEPRTSVVSSVALTSSAQPPTPVTTPLTTEMAPTATTSATPVDGFDSLLAQAEALVRRSRFEEAVGIYEDLARRKPGDPRPQIGWAWVLVLDGEGDLALAHASRAAELAPANAEAAIVLARAYIATVDHAQALATAEKAVRLEPGSAQAHAVLAGAHMVNGQMENAVQEADLALVQDAGNAEAHRIRGWLYYLADQDLARAAGELQSAAGLQPELWLRRHELGELLLHAGDFSTALLAFQDALRLRPEAVTYAAIGEAYYGLGQYDQAQAAIKQALVGKGPAEDAHTVALLAAAQARSAKCDEARTQYERALALDPAEPLALEAQAICHPNGSGTPQAVGVEASPRPPTAVAGSGTTPAATPKPTAKATRRPASLPALSGRIAFPVWNRGRGKYDTYVARVDGGNLRLVVEQMHQPAFSPDGQWLAVKGEGPDQLNLFIVRPDGRDLKRITEYIEDKLPSWSPDGRSLVLATTRDRPGRPKRLYVLDDVPELRRPRDGRVLASEDKPVLGDYATWMPDGRVIYKGCDYTVEPQQCGLFVIRAEGGPFKKLTNNGEDTAPAAHGNRIAFTSNRDGNWEIYLMNDDGSGVKRLTQDPANDGLPTWSPDGKALAFVSNRGGAWAVWAMNPDGSGQRKLFELGDGGLASEWLNERISWAP